MQVDKNSEDLESFAMSIDEAILLEGNSFGCLNSLPDEIIEFILTYLPPYGDLKNCSLVSKRWNTIVKNLVRRSKLNLHKGLADFRLHWQMYSQQTASASNATDHLPSTSSACFNNAPLPIIAGRFSHSAVFHSNSMYIFGGGSSSDTTFNDLWRFDLTRMRWERPVSMGNYPSPKGSASMVQWREQLVLFGGWRYPSLHPPYQPWCLFDELHFYDIPSQRWNVGLTQRSPPPMAGHSASVHGDRMVVFGGYQIADGLNSNSNETWCLELHEQKWWKPRIKDNIKPPPRYGQFQLMIDDKHLLIVGGCGGPNAVYSDAWLLDMSRDAIWVWRTLSIRNKEFAASHMWCNPACKIDSKLVVLGPSPHMPQDFQLKKQLPRMLGGTPRFGPIHDALVDMRWQLIQVMDGQRGNGDLVLPHNRPPPPVVAPALAPAVNAGAGIVGYGRDEHYYANRRAILNQNQQNGINNNYNLFNNRNNNNNNHNNNNHHNNNQHNNNNNLNNNNNNNGSGNLNHLLQPRSGRIIELHASAAGAAQYACVMVPAQEQNRPSSSLPTNASTSRLNGNPDSDSHATNAAVSSENNGSSDKEAANRLQRNLALRCRELEPMLPKRFGELYEDHPRMAAFKEQNSVRNQSKDHHERIRRLEEKMNSIRSRRNLLNNEPKAIKEPSPKRVKRNVLSLFVCDLSAALDEKDPHLEWVEYKNYGVMPGAPERLILSTMVAGHGELILFGGVHKETLSELTHQVSNTIHFLSAPRDIV